MENNKKILMIEIYQCQIFKLMGWMKRNNNK